MFLYNFHNVSNSLSKKSSISRQISRGCKHSIVRAIAQRSCYFFARRRTFSFAQRKCFLFGIIDVHVCYLVIVARFNYFLMCFSPSIDECIECPTVVCCSLFQELKDKSANDFVNIAVGCKAPLRNVFVPWVIDENRESLRSCLEFFIE